ncbi:hypothetical protein [Defluviimonas sp. SAOS-178_SWC]|uniref:hypothetical protein n=1 Tax=Defluviimonas sp. SAOS-178_SWC TaxID=3121287 RepID=UPI0032219FB8
MVYHDKVSFPGMPKGYERVMDLRSFLVRLGLLLCLAPLPAGAQNLSLPGLAVGMKRVTPTIWVDRAAGGKQVEAIRARIAAAERKVGAEFGRLRAAPLWQVCVTKECDRRNAMTSRAMTLGGLVITVSSKAVNDPVTYVHERVHAETHRAEGFAGRKKGLLPTWFDEGLATIISRSVGYPKGVAQCRAVANWKLPATRKEFVALSKSNGKGAGPVYTASACAVQKWLGAGRKPADALGQLRAGRRLP